MKKTGMKNKRGAIVQIVIGVFALCVLIWAHIFWTPYRASWLVDVCLVFNSVLIIYSGIRRLK